MNKIRHMGSGVITATKYNKTKPFKQNRNTPDRSNDEQQISNPAMRNNSLGRSHWFCIMTLSAAVTCGLMLSMSRMIAAEFQIQDKLSDLTYDINPVEKLIVKVAPVTEPEPYEKVEVPPPPPETGFDPTEKVTVPPVTLTTVKPIFKPPTQMIPLTPAISVEKDYSPIQRIAPIMPPRATRSGHCDMRYDVSAEGLPFNVEAISCSETLFARASIKAVQRWKYLPRVQDGRAVSVKDVRTRISFKLTDEAGQLIAARE